MGRLAQTGSLIAAGMLLSCGALWATTVVSAGSSDAAVRGEYVFHAAAGCSCHTDIPNEGPRLAGGRAIETPFGTFYSPNITPDTETGIGGWTERDFLRAMTDGISPEGEHYYPVFPYMSYARMTETDLRDLWAYLSAQTPVKRPNRAHELPWLLSWRSLLSIWKWWYFDGEKLDANPERSGQWNRGAYLVNAPAHCGECHTPRDWLGGPDGSMALAGTDQGPDGELVPNITPDPETGIGQWHTADLAWLLETGLLPDGDSVQGAMAEAIDEGFRFLSAEDRQAIAEYLLSRPPVQNPVE